MTTFVRPLVIALALAAVAAAPASAREPTAGDVCGGFVEQPTMRMEEFVYIGCTSWLAGFGAGQAAAGQAAADAARAAAGVCEPAGGLTTRERALALVDHLRSVASARELPVATAYMAALRARYPCGRRP